MAIQFSGGIAHKHHRGNHSKYEDLNEAKMYLSYQSEYGLGEDEDYEIYQT